jgi:hypothetical protein
MRADKYIGWLCLLIAGFLLGQWSVPEQKLGACVEMPSKMRSLSQDQGAWIRYYRSKAQ